MNRIRSMENTTVKILPEQHVASPTILSKSGLIWMCPLYHPDLPVRRTDSELDANGH